MTSRFHAPRARYIFQYVLGDHYRVRVFPAPDTFPQKELQQQQTREKHLLQMTRLWLSRVPSGNDRALRRLLRHDHPAYATTINPLAHFLFQLFIKRQH